MDGINGIKRDYLASYLRFQLNLTEKLLADIEQSELYEDSYTVESLKLIEQGARKLRWFLENERAKGLWN